MYEIHVNYPAILTVGILSYILGTLWYSRLLFGRRWRESIGKTESEYRNNVKPWIYVLTFICWLMYFQYLFTIAELQHLVMVCLPGFYVGLVL